VNIPPPDESTGTSHLATATVTCTGTSPNISVTGITMGTGTSAGVNYTSMPVVTFSNGPAAATTVTGVATPGVVTSINFTSGSGYTSNPIVTFSGGGATTQATATAGIGTVGAGNTATPEWWQVNLIANILAACVNSTGGVSGDSSPCGTLFANVLNGGTPPADTLQAALDLALHPTLPAANLTALYNLIPASGVPFQPYPSTVGSVTDFSIGIQYQPMAGSTTLLKQPATVEFDSLGNAWVANQIQPADLGRGPPLSGISGGAYSDRRAHPGGLHSRRLSERLCDQ